MILEDKADVDLKSQGYFKIYKTDFAAREHVVWGQTNGLKIKIWQFFIVVRFFDGTTRLRLNWILLVFYFLAHCMKDLICIKSEMCGV